MTLSTKTDLYPYQEAAVQKLLPLRVGALYMEMGTGKTRTALEIIRERAARGKIDRVLWLCPCSVKRNLAVDLDKHATGWADLIRICGIETLSASDRTFADLLAYVNERTMCVVDESNLVKNNFAKRTRRVVALGERCRYRMILNGTPVSRNEADLYAQWCFLDQRIFGYRSFWSFARNHLEYDEHHRVRHVLDVDYLTEKIAPYSVVVRKSDVLQLPEKRYYERVFDLTAAQSYHYADVMGDLLMELDERNEATLYRLFTGLQQVTAGRRVYPLARPMRTEPFFADPHDNPRICCLLDTIGNSAEKIIIWTKYHHEASDIRSVLPAGSSATATGELPVRRRAAEIERFRTDPGCRFLISSKTSGGYGLNLQFCHHAIYYDNDWDYATRAQSEDRIHRLGQEHAVEITDISADAKIDRRILDCLNRKVRLSDEVKEQIAVNGDLKKWLNPAKERSICSKTS